MRITSFFTLLLLGLFIVSCGGATETMENVAEDAMDKAGETMDKAGDMMSGEAVTISPMPATQEFPDAAITDWQYKGGKFMYTTTGYEFAQQTPDADALMCANSGKGQHAHLIINNEPYIAKYEPTFEQALPDGDHYILTFLSRSYHESIKTDAAHRAVMATVKDGAFASTTDIEEPMLFYSRPKGSYVGKANTENIMLDFYPVNVTLGEDGYMVKAEVNGKESFDITEWRPFYLKGLPMGENTVKLTLMKDGKAVEAPLNPVTRTFTVEALPTGE
ncbi:hypothetical protein [Neolewinella agarilytica]|uniref:Phosphopeptide-binding protein n=1 Tax=Neolewinella agarilytica TaxID=478744 RepID=A0A1H9HWM2_9BACT|nr:hypothetical protein [Neolewinella agarilytica]SEQ66677.1 hypothetical protein SAMN05444359_113136 [Neolewinella agarilytica]